MSDDWRCDHVDVGTCEECRSAAELVHRYFATCECGAEVTTPKARGENGYPVCDACLVALRGDEGQV